MLWTTLQTSWETSHGPAVSAWSWQFSFKSRWQSHSAGLLCGVVRPHSVPSTLAPLVRRAGSARFQWKGRSSFHEVRPQVEKMPRPVVVWVRGLDEPVALRSFSSRSNPSAEDRAAAQLATYSNLSNAAPSPEDMNDSVPRPNSTQFREQAERVNSLCVQKPSQGPIYCLARLSDYSLSRVPNL